ncbi:MAG: alpha-amylase family glycosyl hydrolase [Massilia sp.]
MQLPRLLCAAALALCFAPTLAICAPTAAPMAHIAWSRNANIYEVNLRQYTKEGTIKAFATHLPRLKKLGVDILWIMPVQPIGVKERKGTLGSYYAVKDYTAVNPEFGTLSDFKSMVKQAHALGMHVILDWVPNHTAWDNAWATEHKDWYKKNDKGEIYPVTFTGDNGTEYWTDVIGLDYTNHDLWKGMTDAMAFWVRETNIDGFRCDVAGQVPVPFWNHAVAELNKIKPLFMLAEADQVDLHQQAFDMTYAWDLAEVFKAIGKGKASAPELAAFLSNPPKQYPREAYRMLFTNNHDFNSWNGTDRELYGPAYKALAMLTTTLPGMPLIYGGQEAGLDKRLEFFEKDPIAWKDYPLSSFYAGLLKLKKQNPALANGQYGAPLELLATANDKVFAFQRHVPGNTVKVTVNLSGQPQSYTLAGAPAATLAAWSWDIKTGR